MRCVTGIQIVFFLTECQSIPAKGRALMRALPFDDEGKGRSRCVLMYGCMPSKFNGGFIC